MRLAILALSAAAISGCSWLGGGSGQQMHQTAGCYPAGGAYQQAGYQQSGYQHHYGYAQSAGCRGGVYGGQPSVPGYGSDAYGYQYGGGQSFAAQGYGGATQTAQAGHGYAAGGYQAGTTTLGASAPYGASVSSQYATGGSQYAGAGQYGQTARVQTVVGAPLYVGQPYPVPQLRGSACCGAQGYIGGGAMPFGVELFAGTEFEASGNLFTKKSVGPPDGDFTIGVRVGAINPITYDDAFGATKTIGGALSYDISPNTTVLGSIAHGVAEGQTVNGYTTVQPGTWVGTTFTPTAGSTPRSLDGSFTDLETTTLEAGLRHYVGMPQGLRPYVGATAGFVHNGDVQFTQTYSDDGTYYGEREFIESGWNPTASATLGAELALSPRAGIGVESGIRWRDDMNTAAPSEDRITIPLTFRGRLSF
ncbi:MAG: hypothetical protein ACSHX3_00265 [Litorimonas sp.]